MIGKTIKEIKVGDRELFSRTISESDVYMFGGITGDLNPAHFNEEESKKTMFGGRIVHGMLTASYISTILGMYLPGPGTIFISNKCTFLKPVKIGDTITAEVEAVEVVTEKNRVIFKTKCTNQDGVVVLNGEAEVMPPK